VSTHPVFTDGRKWWGVESVRKNRDTGETFRVFEAVTGHDEAAARANVAESDKRLDEELMRTAIRKGDVQGEWDWETFSAVIERRRVTLVTSSAQIAAIDPGLLAMLRSHEFFFDELEEDAATAIGGGVYPVD
jgi:hypothetical protein